MSKQSFGEDSNWKHEPHAEHYVKDKFGKGTETRNWKKNLDPNLEEKEEEAKLSDIEETDSEMEELEAEIKRKKAKAEKSQPEH